jgi:hypothetical protein
VGRAKILIGHNQRKKHSCTGMERVRDAAREPREASVGCVNKVVIEKVGQSRVEAEQWSLPR